MARQKKPKEEPAEEPQGEAQDQEDISFTLDELLTYHTKNKQLEEEAGSSNSTARNLTGQFVKQTGLHAKALSQVRTGLKIKSEAGRLDWLKSMELLIAEVAPHIRGQSSGEMDFGS